MRILFLVLILCLNCKAAKDDFSNYINLASDKKLDMNSRWQALIKAAELASLEQVDEIKKFSSNEEWYMRNASLVALSKINRAAAMAEAKKLIQDKALVVRSAAVEVVAKDLTQDNKELLLAEFNQPYNFHKKSSLWIRKQIVESISAVASASDRRFFAKNLFDSDREVAEISARALEKISGESINETRSLKKWQSIAKDKNWL
jgi:HEAT repeat protein